MPKRKSSTPQSNEAETQPFIFPGFRVPYYTQVPDEVIDVLMPVLSGAEFKIVVYICRRTFGFRRDSDDISLNQLVNGITTKDGRVLDRGTGLTVDTVVRALKSLEAKKVLIKKKKQSQARGFETNNYALNMMATTPVSPVDAPYSENQSSPLLQKTEMPPTQKIGVALLRKSEIQETALQNTVVIQETETTTQPSLLEDNGTDVVVALTSHGLSSNVAKKLVTKYGSEYCLTKLEYFEFVQETAPTTFKKSPTGWLRAAIEKDFAPPDGFISRADQEQEERQFALEQEREDELARQAMDRRKWKAQLEKENYAKWRKQLNLEYGTTEEDFALWEQALLALERVYSGYSDKTVYNELVASAEILCVEENGETATVFLGVETQYAVGRLKHRNKLLFERELKYLLHKPVQVEFIVVGTPEPVMEDEVEDDHMIVEPFQKPLVAVNGYAH